MSTSSLVEVLQTSTIMKIIISSLSYKNHASLTVYAHTEKNEFSLHRMPVTEIHGDTRKKIALALLSNYPHKLILWGALAAEFDAPEGVCRVLDQLQNLKKPIREKEIMEVLQNPTLENVERFVALRKLLE